MTDVISDRDRPAVRGVDLDAETRCRHYHGPTDIIAIKFVCCGEYFACHDCHVAIATHAPEPWPADAFDTRAVLCGACGHEMTIREYLASNARCPQCDAAFNPRCRNHYHLYFAVAGS